MCEKVVAGSYPEKVTFFPSIITLVKRFPSFSKWQRFMTVISSWSIHEYTHCPDTQAYYYIDSILFRVSKIIITQTNKTSLTKDRYWRFYLCTAIALHNESWVLNVSKEEEKLSVNNRSGYFFKGNDEAQDPLDLSLIQCTITSTFLVSI